jgi:molybdate transport system regulatory protein
MVYPKASLRIELGPEERFGPGKIRLLELVGTTGSISAAAREMDMSYRRAWLLIDEMNRIFKEPVVAAVTGGAHGGGATLTALGEKLIGIYRGIERDSTALAMRKIGALMEAEAKPQPAAARRSKRT